MEFEIAGDAEIKNEIDRASWEQLSPDERIGRSLYDVKEEAIREIKAAKKESVIFSYKMLIAGTALGTLGSMFITAIFRWYDTQWALNSNAVLTIIMAVCFFFCIILIFYNIEKMRNS